MIRAIRINSMCLDDHQGMLTGWNVLPDKPWRLTLSPSSNACGVLLWDGGTIVATGAALTGVNQPCVLVPSVGQSLDMLDPDLGWHLLISTIGTEAPLSIDMDPVVDLSDVIHPIYQAETLAQARATADIDAATHYVDKITFSCPHGLGAGLGAVVGLDVDDQGRTGQVESLIFTGRPDGWEDLAIIKHYVAITPGSV